MDRRTIPALLLGGMAIACAVGAFDKERPQAPTVTTTEALPTEDENALIRGVVTHRDHRGSIEGALVVLQCTCLESHREAVTNVDGLYGFHTLPAGEYTIQVLYGRADVSRKASLKRGFKVRIDFQLDPENDFVRT